MTTTGPIRLQRLELENFRGFEKLALDFEPDLTVLVGANGAGKSTVLDGIVAAAARRMAPTDFRIGSRRASAGATPRDRTKTSFTG